MKELKNYILVFLLIIVGSTLCYSSGNNMKMNYQGYLKSGGVVVNGTKWFKFYIRDGAGGAVQWESDCTQVTVSTGVFRATLGNTSVGNDWNSIDWQNIDAHLEIVLGDPVLCANSVSMTPQERLLSVPYSLFATTAAAAATNTINSTMLASDSASLSKVTGGIMSISGSDVGVSSSAPVSKLAVEGGTVTASGFVVTGGGNFSGNGMLPSGSIVFFNLNSCPSGWSELTAGQGRYIVGLNSGGALAQPIGTALSDLEGRTVGQHTHPVTVTDPGHAHSFGIHPGGAQGDTWNGGCSYPQNNSSADTTGSATTGITATASSSTGAAGTWGTPAPYIQLLVCRKN